MTRNKGGIVSDPEDTSADSASMVAMTSDIVAVFAGHNQIDQSEVPNLIRSVHATLSGLADSQGEPKKVYLKDETPPAPAVPIDASVTPDAIICLEDGKAFKTLKRHLRTAFDMSPEEYRKRWGLSKDYPMVAPNYSARRAATAKAIGLGRKPGAKVKKT